jgi:hypothetical protein
VIRVIATMIVLAASLAVGVTASRAADECKGLMVCIPVAGPWVVIPASRGAVATADWKLVCPEGVVGGVDARATEKAVVVAFPGRIGSPVNPGITTTESLVFRGTYTGLTSRATSYRPFIGCIPGGGGQRTPTSVSRAEVVKPGEPITTRIVTVRVVAGTLARAKLGCRPGERLLRAGHSVGLFTNGAPAEAQRNAVRVIRVVRSGKILVSATRSGTLADNIRAVVQLQAECTR